MIPLSDLEKGYITEFDMRLWNDFDGRFRNVSALSCLSNFGGVGVYRLNEYRGCGSGGKQVRQKEEEKRKEKEITKRSNEKKSTASFTSRLPGKAS